MTDPVSNMTDAVPPQDDEVQVKAGAPRTRTLVVAEGLGKVFDISPPWLNRVIERLGPVSYTHLTLPTTPYV